ncbi:MAG: c-type cytochrome [Campylobacterota bacterium]|nr:c-type cytochrome [Campylobacterota bacterium]
MRFITIFFLISTFLLAKTPYESGKTLYLQKGCFSCHGNKAEGLHKYPYLANRAKGYLAYKLKRFRDKLSDNQQQEMMVAYAVDLSDKDIDDLTTFLNEYKDDDFEESYDDSFQTHGDGGS